MEKKYFDSEELLNLFDWLLSLTKEEKEKVIEETAQRFRQKGEEMCRELSVLFEEASVTHPEKPIENNILEKSIRECMLTKEPIPNAASKPIRYLCYLRQVFGPWEQILKTASPVTVRSGDTELDGGYRDLSDEIYDEDLLEYGLEPDYELRLRVFHETGEARLIVDFSFLNEGELPKSVLVQVVIANEDRVLGVAPIEPVTGRARIELEGLHSEWDQLAIVICWSNNNEEEEERRI